MSRTIQFKRYANTVVANTTGASGEIIIDQTNHTVTVHDGVTLGGVRLATELFAMEQTGDGTLAIAQGAYATANAAFTQANNALTQAQNGINDAILGINDGIAAGVLAQAAFNEANTIASNVATVTANQIINTGNIAVLNANVASINVVIAGFNTQVTTLNNEFNNNITSINNLQSEINVAFNQANSAAILNPQNPQSANYTIVNSDAGKHLYYTNGSPVNLYIPWTANTSFANGTYIHVVSHSTANVIVTPNTGVSLYASGNSISGNHNVTSYGVATLRMVAANTWFISGTVI
jgi:hypothetical protein